MKKVFKDFFLKIIEILKVWILFSFKFIIVPFIAFLRGNYRKPYLFFIKNFRFIFIFLFSLFSGLLLVFKLLFFYLIPFLGRKVWYYTKCIRRIKRIKYFRRAIYLFYRKKVSYKKRRMIIFILRQLFNFINPFVDSIYLPIVFNGKRYFKWFGPANYVYDPKERSKFFKWTEVLGPLRHFGPIDWDIYYEPRDFNGIRVRKVWIYFYPILLYIIIYFGFVGFWQFFFWYSFLSFIVLALPGGRDDREYSMVVLNVFIFLWGLPYIGIVSWHMCFESDFSTFLDRFWNPLIEFIRNIKW